MSGGLWQPPGTTCPEVPGEGAEPSGVGVGNLLSLMLEICGEVPKETREERNQLLS